MIYDFFCRLNFCWPRNFIDIFHPTKIWSVVFITSNCALISVSSANKVIKKRSRHRRCSVKEVVLRNFAKFTGKHLCQSLFSDKVVGLGPATLLKKETLALVFFCEFCKIFKDIFPREQLSTTASEKINVLPLHSVNRSCWSAEAYLEPVKSLKWSVLQK